MDVFVVAGIGLFIIGSIIAGVIVGETQKICHKNEKLLWIFYILSILYLCTILWLFFQGCSYRIFRILVTFFLLCMTGVMIVCLYNIRKMESSNDFDIQTDEQKKNPGIEGSAYNIEDIFLKFLANDINVECQQAKPSQEEIFKSNNADNDTADLNDFPSDFGGRY